MNMYTNNAMYTILFCNVIPSHKRVLMLSALNSIEVVGCDGTTQAGMVGQTLALKLLQCDIEGLVSDIRDVSAPARRPAGRGPPSSSPS